MAVLRTRWVQLSVGILCMVMIANLQYGWTLFVLPISNGHGWARSDVQWAFTVFFYVAALLNVTAALLALLVLRPMRLSSSRRLAMEPLRQPG